MSVTWMTKYGPRRVRHEPPTLEEALFAAEGLADEPSQQMEIAAELMQIPVEQVRKDAARLMKDRGPRRVVTIASRSRTTSTVVVERKTPRRIVIPPRKGTTAA
jgi:hypothetical protein